jgi:hypothetical protein
MENSQRNQPKKRDDATNDMSSSYIKDASLSEKLDKLKLESRGPIADVKCQSRPKSNTYQSRQRITANTWKGCQFYN